MLGPTREIASFARRFELELVGEPARRVARASILDTFACALGALDERVTRAVGDYVEAEGSAGSATIWGTAVRASPARAALANATAAHALDFDDVSWAMHGHPSAPLLGAVMAMAEARRASGAEMLAAYIAGFEAQARLGQALTRSHYARGWHPTSTLGAIGAAVAAGRLLGLGERELRCALGIACSEAAGSRMNFGTDTKPLHAGLAAQAGVLAAELAARGVSAREDGLEADMGLADLYGGARPLELSTLGGPFALESPGVELKPYPSCRFTHRAIDAVLALQSRLDDRARATDAIESIACDTDPFAKNILIYARAANGLEAKFCLQYCVAVAWLDGAPGVAAFADARCRRSDVSSLAARVRVRDAEGPDEVVSVTFESGRRESARVRFPLGSPERPMSDDDLRRKARALALPAIGSDAVERLIACVTTLESLSDLSPVVGALSRT